MNLDHVEHLVHEYPIPVVTKGQYQVRAGPSCRPGHSQQCGRVYDRHNPTPQMRKPKHSRGREWHPSQATIPEHLDDCRRIDGEAGISYA